MPSQEQAAPVAISTGSRSVAASRRGRTSGLWGIFDFSFQHYVTPEIIRVTWALVLLFSGLTLILVVSSLAVNLAAASGSDARPDASPNLQFTLPGGDTIDLNGEGQVSGSGASTGSQRASEMVDAVFQYAFWPAIRICAVVLGVLWIRVLLETSIVVFNIAKTLQSIDAKTRSR